MTKQARFTKAFEDEAVRLVATSGRTQHEIAEDLEVDLSTLVRCINRCRDQLAKVPEAGIIDRQPAPARRRGDAGARPFAVRTGE